MNKKKVKLDAHSEIFDPELKDIINGYVMGDGYINKRGILTVDQGEKQKKFVEWLRQKLDPIVTENCTIQEVTRERGKPSLNGSSDKNKNQKKTITKSYRFNTRSVLKDFFNNWYGPDPKDPSKNKKKLPTNIADLFTPLFIIVWFACDGTNVIGSRGAKFEVTSLSVDERILLKNLFLSKYNINTNIIKSGFSTSRTQQWVLSINSEDYDKFRALITQYDLIEKLFSYKLQFK